MQMLPAGRQFARCGRCRAFLICMMCMDRLFREAQLPTTFITRQQIPDFSTKVPVATKDMIITALSQMSRLSNAFRYVD